MRIWLQEQMKRKGRSILARPPHGRLCTLHVQTQTKPTALEQQVRLGVDAAQMLMLLSNVLLQNLQHASTMLDHMASVHMAVAPQGLRVAAVKLQHFLKHPARYASAEAMRCGKHG